MRAKVDNRPLEERVMEDRKKRLTIQLIIFILFIAVFIIVVYYKLIPDSFMLFRYLIPVGAIVVFLLYNIYSRTFMEFARYQDEIAKTQRQPSFAEKTKEILILAIVLGSLFALTIWIFFSLAQ